MDHLTILIILLLPSIYYQHLESFVIQESINFVTATIVTAGTYIKSAINKTRNRFPEYSVETIKEFDLLEATLQMSTSTPTS